MPEHVVEEPGRLPAAGLEEAGRERVRDDEVPVAARSRGGDGVERLVPREQRDRDEERAVLQLPLRLVDRAAEADAEPRCQVPRLARELRVVRCVEDVGDRVQALPDGRLPVEREDTRADVGREPLADEQAVAVRAVDLPGEVVEQVRDRRGDALEVVAVAGEAVVEGDRGQLLADPPVRALQAAPASCAGSPASRRGSPYSAITSAASSASANENSSYWLPTLYRQVSARSWISRLRWASLTTFSGTSKTGAAPRRAIQKSTSRARGGVVRRLLDLDRARRRTARGQAP